MLLHQFRSPVIYILVAAAVVTFAIGEYIDTGVIAAVLHESAFTKRPLSNPFLLVATAASLVVHGAELYLAPTQFVLRVEPDRSGGLDADRGDSPVDRRCRRGAQAAEASQPQAVELPPSGDVAGSRAW